MKILLILMIVFVVILVGIQIYNRFLTSSVAGGLIDGKFAPCSPKPNCVSSMSEDRKKLVEPIVVADDSQWEELLKRVSAMSRVRLVTRNGSYVYFTFSSLVMGYIDDVELKYNVTKKVVEVRSASRVGYSDYNVNRKRVENLRELAE